MPRKVDQAAELNFVKEKELDGESINIDTLTEEDEPEEQDRHHHHGVDTARLSPSSTPSFPEDASRRRSNNKRKVKGRQPAAAANFGEQHWKDLNAALLQISLENMHRLYELAPSLDPWRPKGRLNEKVRQFYRHARGATSGHFPSFPQVEHDVQPTLPLPRSLTQPSSPQKKDTDGSKSHSASSSSRRSSSASISSPLPPSPSSPTSSHFLFTSPSSLYSNPYNGRSNLLASPSTPTNARPILCQPGARTRRLMEIPLLASPSWPPSSYRSAPTTNSPTTYNNNNNNNNNNNFTTTTSTAATTATNTIDTPRTSLLPIAHSARLASTHSEDLASSYSYTYSHSARRIVPPAAGREIVEIPRQLSKPGR